MKSHALALAAILAAAGAAAAAAEPCTVTREQVLADVARGLSPEELAAKYAGCTAAGEAMAADPEPSVLAAVPPPIDSEHVTDTGSTLYEAIKSCGYHPQREEADCTVEIRRRSGYGGQICQSQGSHEYLLFCVDYGAGFVPVHTNGFHVYDAAGNPPPRWSFSGTIQSNPRLLAQPNLGQTLRGRVILSWAIPPAGCAAMPIWGNQSDFRFRLDP